MRVSSISAPLVRPQAGPSPAPTDSVSSARVSEGGDEILHRLMAEMVRGADSDFAIASTRIRTSSREAARSRMRVLEEVRKQARARRRSRPWRAFKKFLLGVAAVVGAAAAIVASPFTGGGSIATYVGTALGIGSAVAAGGGAAAGIAEGVLGARAEMAGVRSRARSADLREALGDLESEAMRAAEVVSHAAALEQRVIEIERRTAGLASTAMGGRQW